jgi:aminoglycoside phosphotransferase (APT) family kinase protein
MRREIECVVMPELQTAYGKLAAGWVCQAIDYLLLGEHDDPAVAAARAALLATLPASANERKEFEYLPDVRDPNRAIDQIAAAVRQLGSATPPKTIAAIGAIAARALAEETNFLESRRVAAIDKLDALEIPVTPDRLDRYFNSTVEFAGYKTTEVVRMVGGYSRDTFLVSARMPDGGTADFAVRRDLPFGPVESSAADEFGYLEKIGKLGVPVARPRAAVYDKSFLGEPFLLGDRVVGVVADGPMSADRRVGENGARQMAQILAGMHALDPRQVGLNSASGDPRRDIAATIDYWRARWRRYRCLESDVMEAAFVWLDANVPKNVERTVIIHGDYRPGNAMMDGGKITGILDWEFIHLGDPAEDVEYMKLFVQPFLGAAEFAAEYAAAGGAPYDPDSANFYEVFRSVRNVVCCDTAWHGFLHGFYPSMRLSFQGTTARRMLMMYLAQAIEKTDKKYRK